MTGILSGILIAFFAACGLAAIMFCLAGALFAQKDVPTILLIPADASTLDLELQLKHAKWQLGILPGKEERFIIVLDNGMGEQQREIALMESRDGGNILILRANELKNLP